MRNKYPGNCVRCGKFVPPGEGYFEKVYRGDPKSPLHHDKRTRWVVRCMDCVGKGHERPKDHE